MFQQHFQQAAYPGIDEIGHLARHYIITVTKAISDMITLIFRLGEPRRFPRFSN